MLKYSSPRWCGQNSHMTKQDGGAMPACPEVFFCLLIVSFAKEIQNFTKIFLIFFPMLSKNRK